MNFYVLKKKWWDWGSGDIYDRAGITIGKMHRRILSLRALTEVTESDGTVVFTVNKKLISIRPSYMLKDAAGNLLGRTNRKILTLFRPKLWLENDSGEKLLEAQGNFLGRDFHGRTSTVTRRLESAKATSSKISSSERPCLTSPTPTPCRSRILVMISGYSWAS